MSSEHTPGLISAAPDMLEALEAMRDNATIRATCPSPLWATMVSAIAKARGVDFAPRSDDMGQNDG